MLRGTNFNHTGNIVAWQLVVALVCGAFSPLIHTDSARACACCSELGMRVEATTNLSTYERNQLERMRFDEKAKLYMTEAFPDDINGIIDPSEQPYELRHIAGPDQWIFELTDNRGRRGTIAIPLPQRLARFMVDPRDGSSSPGGGPGLYKEWRLSNVSTLSGLLAESSDKAQATLILQGHGNGCTEAEDFTHWTLQLSGPNVQFRLLGTLAEPD